MVRGVLYTALTRARELLILVGDDAAVRAMAANDRQQRRYSASGGGWHILRIRRRDKGRQVGCRWRIGGTSHWTRDWQSC